MEMLEFRKDFIEEVKSTAEAEKDFTEAAFVTVAAGKLIDAEEIPDFTPCYYEGTGKRNRKLRVDAYWFDEADGSVILIIAEYSGGELPEVLTQTKADRVLDMVGSFAEEALTGQLHPRLDESSPGFGLSIDLYHQRDSITKIRMYLLSDVPASERIKDIPVSQISGKPMESHVWDISRFHKVFLSKTGREDLDIDFEGLISGGLS